jgi:putative addiction module component (TIGR02574 family)
MIEINCLRSTSLLARLAESAGAFEGAIPLRWDRV